MVLARNPFSRLLSFEVVLLIGLILALPSLEAPKNLLWLAYLVTWLVNRFRSRNFGGPWDKWDSLIALWIVTGYAIAPFAGLPHSEWGGANDILRYAALLWLVKRSGYSPRELIWLIAAMALSTAIALGYGLWEWLVAHRSSALQLNSVGHVNHSAVYLAISFGALLAAMMAFWAKLGGIPRLLGMGLALVFAAAVVLSASRAAAGILLLLPLLLGIAWLRRSRVPLAILLLSTLLLAGSVYFIKPEVVQKQETNVKANNILAFRDQIWNTALAAWEKYPWFGVGMHNFNRIPMEQIKTWRAEAGKPYDPARYIGTAHAHSLYFNTLAERGIVGAAVLASVLLFWLYSLIRFLPQSGGSDLDWALWGGSMSAWVVSSGIGLVNTTLHHEHGMLAALLLGMWLAGMRAKPNPAKPEPNGSLDGA